MRWLIGQRSSFSHDPAEQDWVAVSGGLRWRASAWRSATQGAPATAKNPALLSM